MSENTDTPILEEKEDLFDSVTWDEETTEAEEPEKEVPEEPETDEEPIEEKTEEEKPFDWASLELKGIDGTKKLSEYTPEEAKALLQKGEDYDRVREGYDQFKQVKEIAKLYDMDPKDLVGTLKENHFKNKAEKNGTTEEFEKKQYELAVKELEIKQKENQAEEAKNKEKMFEEFVAEYPDADPYNLPKEVVEAVNKGQDINGAYAKYKNKEMAKELQKLKKQMENLQKAPVTPTTSNGHDTLDSEDDFMKGFLGK